MTERQQNELTRGFYNILVRHCKDNIFSDASVGCKWPGSPTPAVLTINCQKTAAGCCEQLKNESFFDLASLTKPLVTLLSVLVLLEKKKISWDESLGSLLNRDIPQTFKDIDLKSLLCHNSGLPAHVEYWRKLKEIEKKDRKKWVIDRILSENINKKEPPKHLYSDLGYILLGYIVEQISKTKLNNFWEEQIAKPLGITKTLNYPANFKDNRQYYIPTGVCPWSKRLLNGIVHDDNCRAIGGVCGHAGLFGTTEAVLTLCQELLNILKGYKSRISISTELLKESCLRVGNSEWTNGFNLPSIKGSSSGRFLSSESIGHLGFTGTSFWIDPVQELVVVLLTNRVFMGQDTEGIKKLRPEIHDFVVERTTGNENRHLYR